MFGLITFCISGVTLSRDVIGAIVDLAKLIYVITLGAIAKLTLFGSVVS